MVLVGTMALQVLPCQGLPPQKRGFRGWVTHTYVGAKLEANGQDGGKEKALEHIAFNPTVLGLLLLACICCL